MTIPTIKHPTTKRGTIILEQRIEFIIGKEREEEMINDLQGIRQCESEQDARQRSYSIRIVQGDDLSFLNRDWPMQYLKDL